MASINLLATEYKYVFGWYGTCEENTSFDLNTIKQYLMGVYQVNSQQTSWKVYNPDLPSYLAQDFSTLESGFIYLFIFKSDPATPAIEIEGLVTTSWEANQTSENKVVPDCSTDKSNQTDECCDNVNEVLKMITNILELLPKMGDGCLPKKDDSTPTPSDIVIPSQTPTPTETPTISPSATQTPILQQTPTPTEMLEQYTAVNCLLNPHNGYDAYGRHSSGLMQGSQLGRINDTGDRLFTLHWYNPTNADYDQDGNTTTTSVTTGGGVHIWERISGEWKLVEELKPSEGHHWSGHLDQSTDYAFPSNRTLFDSVAINKTGTVVAMGGIKLNGPGWGNNASGGVVVYQRDNQGAWSLMGQGLIGGENVADFGMHISMNEVGDMIAVTAWGPVANAMVFKYNTTNDTWEQFGQTLQGNILPYESNTESYTVVNPGDIESHLGANLLTRFDPTAVTMSPDGLTIAVLGKGVTRVFDWNGSDTWIQRGGDITWVGFYTYVHMTSDTNTLVFSDGTGDSIPPPSPQDSPQNVNNGVVRLWRYNATNSMWEKTTHRFDGQYSGDALRLYGMTADASKLFIGVGRDPQANNNHPSTSHHAYINVYDHDTNTDQYNISTRIDTLNVQGAGLLTPNGERFWYSTIDASTGKSGYCESVLISKLPTPTPTISPSATQTPILQQTPTPTETPTISPSATQTPILQQTPTPTETPSNPVPTDTNVPVPTDTNVPVPTDTNVPVPTDTNVPVPTDTNVPVPTDTNVPVPTDTTLPPDDINCANDVKTCFDGSVVTRDPNNNCAFANCPEPPTGPFDDDPCADDTKRCADGSFVGRDPDNNCAFIACPEDDVVCTSDAVLCSNGEYVGRDPNNNCEFFDCPDDDVVCPQDVKLCADGSYVGRNKDNNCAFDSCPDDTCPDGETDCGNGVFVGKDPTDNCNSLPCPPELSRTPTPTAIPQQTPTPTDGVTVCPQDSKLCGDGSYVSRDPYNNCEFTLCPGDDVNCSQDSLRCPDGTFVGRNPSDNCNFYPCPGVINNCAKDVKECADGSYVGRYGSDCEFSPCPGDDVNCPGDVKQCSDGSYVGRDPYNNCKFISCPGDDIICPQDVKLCPNGEYVKRDPFNNCAFVPCPGDSDCVGDHIMCPDGTFVSRNPADCDEFLPCPAPPLVNPPLPPTEDCPTSNAPDFITICVTGLSIDAMNGEYQGPVPLDHNPFQYGFYHVDSPLDAFGNRRWFIATDTQVTRYQLKDLDTNDPIVESQPKEDLSPCTPVQKGTYPFCVDWSGTGITASECPRTPTPTPILQQTPTPLDPNYTPTSTIALPPLEPTGPGGETPTGPSGPSGPGGPYGPGGPGGGGTGGGGGGRGSRGRGVFTGRWRPGGRGGWPWTGGRRRPGGGYPWGRGGPGGGGGWRPGGGRWIYPGCGYNCGTGGWTYPKPGGGWRYCRTQSSVLVRHIWNRSIVRRVYPMYGLRLGDLVRVSHDGGLDCHVVIGSQCVAPNGYVIPNNCKQHCSSSPPVDCNTSCDIPTESWKKSRFNYLDRDTIVTPDTCTHSMYTFTGKEYPSAVCVTGFEGCYQVYSGSHAFDCHWDSDAMNGTYYFLNPITGKDIFGRSLKKAALGHNILGQMYRTRNFAFSEGGGRWKPMWVHERFFKHSNNFYRNGKWESRYTGILFPIYPDIQNDNDTNGRWVIQHNQYTSGSIHAFSQKVADTSNDNWIKQPHCADWHPHGARIEVCGGPVVLEESYPWPPTGPGNPHDNSCTSGYALKVVPYNTNAIADDIEGLVRYEAGLKINDIIRISTDYGYGCWKIIDILCAETEHYVLYKSNNACVPGGWDAEDPDYPEDTDPEPDCESFGHHCRGVEVYGQWEQDDSVIGENLDLNNIDQLTLNQSDYDNDGGDGFGTDMVIDSNLVLVKTDDHDHACELQIRWSQDISGYHYLQARYLLKPSNQTFDTRDTTEWSTLYGLEDAVKTEDDYTINHQNWPDAGVAGNYTHETSAEFGGMIFTLDDTETSNDGYYQLYVEVKADSDGEYSHSVADATRKMPLFIYIGDNADSENLASGKSGMWPTIVAKDGVYIPPIAQSTPTPTETPTNDGGNAGGGSGSTVSFIEPDCDTNENILLPDDTSIVSRFGRSVAMDGDYAAVASKIGGDWAYAANDSEPGLCEIQFYKKDENNQFQNINKVTLTADTEGWANHSSLEMKMVGDRLVALGQEKAPFGEGSSVIIWKKCIFVYKRNSDDTWTRSYTIRQNWDGLPNSINSTDENSVGYNADSWGMDFYFTGSKIAISSDSILNHIVAPEGGDANGNLHSSTNPHRDGQVYIYTVNSDETWKLDKMVFPTHTYGTDHNQLSTIFYGDKFAQYPFDRFGYGVRFDENYLYVTEQGREAWQGQAAYHSRIHIYDINQEDSESGYAFVTTLTIDQLSGMPLNHSLIMNYPNVAKINNIDLLGGNLIVTIHFTQFGGDPLIVELSETSTGVWERVQDISYKWSSHHPTLGFSYNNNWREQVRVDSDRIAIYNFNIGYVQILEKNATGSWEETHAFKYPCSSGSEPGFGSQTSISGDFLLIGHSGDSSQNNTDVIHGSVFYYQLDSAITPPIAQQTPTPTETPTGPLYGDLWVIAHSDSTINSYPISRNGVPQQVENSHGNLTSISSPHDTVPGGNVFLKEDGTLWMPGYGFILNYILKALNHYVDDNGNVIQDTSYKTTYTPKVALNNVDFYNFDESSSLHYKLKNDNKLYAVGKGTYLGVGYDHDQETSSPMVVIKQNGEPLTDVIEVTKNNYRTYFRCADGSVYGCGQNAGNLYGFTSSETWIPYADLVWPANPGAKKVLSYSSNALILTTDKKLYAVGSKLFGDLNPTTSSNYITEFTLIDTDVEKIYETRDPFWTKSDGKTYATCSLQRQYCVGYNTGVAGEVYVLVDSSNNPITNIQDIQSGNRHMTNNADGLMLKADGTIYRIAPNSITQLKWQSGENITNVNAINVHFSSYSFKTGEITPPIAQSTPTPTETPNVGELCDKEILVELDQHNSLVNLTDHFPEYIEVSGAPDDQWGDPSWYNDIYKLTYTQSGNYKNWAYAKSDPDYLDQVFYPNTTVIGDKAKITSWNLNNEPLEFNCSNIISETQYENWVGTQSYIDLSIGPNFKIVATTPQTGSSNPDSSDHSDHEDVHHHEDQYDHANEEGYHGQSDHDFDIPSANENEHDHSDHYTHGEDHNKHFHYHEEDNHSEEYSDSDEPLQIKYSSMNFNNQLDVDQHQLSKLSKIKLLGEFANGKYEVVAELSPGETFKSDKVITGVQFEKIKTNTNEFYVSSITTESNKVSSTTLEYGCMGYYLPTHGIYGNFENDHFKLSLTYDSKSNCV